MDCFNACLISPTVSGRLTKWYGVMLRSGQHSVVGKVDREQHCHLRQHVGSMQLDHCYVRRTAARSCDLTQASAGS